MRLGCIGLSRLGELNLGRLFEVRQGRVDFRHDYYVTLGKESI